MNFLKTLINSLLYGFKRDGLIDKKDDRDFDLGAVGIKVTKKDLPTESFDVFVPTPLDQLDSDFCVGYSGAYVAEATEGIKCSGAYLFAMSKKLSNKDWRTWGTSILAVMGARQKYGVCAKELWDYKRRHRASYANFNNIPKEAHDDALKHRGGAYFRVRWQDGMDMYDTMCAILNKYKGKKLLIQTGRDRHAWTIIGWDKKKGIKRIDSYGHRTLKKGIGYVNRKTANKLYTPYVIFDIERELAELLIAYNEKAVKIKDNPKCYLIRDGKKCSLDNEAIAWANNTLLFDDNYVFEITKDELKKIPMGKPVKFKDGKNWKIVQRILEKTNRTDLI